MIDVAAPDAVLISTASPPLRSSGPGKLQLAVITGLLGVVLGLLALGGSRLVTIRRNDRRQAFAAG